MNIYGWYFLFMNFMLFVVLCYSVLYVAVYEKTLREDKSMIDYYIREQSFFKWIKFKYVIPIAFIVYNYDMIMRQNDNLVTIPLLKIFFNI